MLVTKSLEALRQPQPKYVKQKSDSGTIVANQKNKMPLVFMVRIRLNINEINVC